MSPNYEPINLLFLVPGATKNDVEVEIDSQDLRVAGKCLSPLRGDTFAEVWDKFEYFFRLSQFHGANFDEIQVSLKDGALRVRIPYQKGAKPRRIVVD